MWSSILLESKGNSFALLLPLLRQHTVPDHMKTSKVSRSIVVLNPVSEL